MLSCCSSLPGGCGDIVVYQYILPDYRHGGSMRIYRIWYMVGGGSFSRITAGRTSQEAIDRLHSRYTANKAYGLKIMFLKKIDL